MVLITDFLSSFYIIKMKKLIITLVACASLTLSAGARTVQGRPWPGTDASTHPSRVAALSDYPEDPTSPDGENHDFDVSQIENWSGTGSNSAYLVIQWNTAGETNAKVFGYRFDGEKTGIDMIMAVAAANPQFYFLTHYTNYGYTVAGLGWDSNADRNIALVLDGKSHIPAHDTGYVITTAYNYDNWAPVDDTDMWASGWYSNGYWSYYTKDSFDDDFGYSSVGASSRALADGTVDGWMFSSFSGSSSEWKELAGAPAANGGATFSLDGISYRVIGDKENAVEVIGADIANVALPASVSFNGSGYTVSGVADNAFASKAITSFTAEKLSYIGNNAFAGCTALASATVKQGLAYTGNNAFSGCAALATVAFPENWAPTDITGSSIFENCAALTSVPFPTENTYIAPAYFKGSGIATFTLPETVTEFGAAAFAGSAIKDFTTGRLTPPAIPADFFSGISADATLHVPYCAAEAYRNADGWSAFANIVEAKPESGALPVGTKFQNGNFWYCVTSQQPAEVELAYPGDTPVKFVYSMTNSYSFTDLGNEITIPSIVTNEDVDYAVTGIGDFAFAKAANGSVNSKKTLRIIDENGNLNSNIRRIGRYAFASALYFSGFEIGNAAEVLGAGAFYNTNFSTVLTSDHTSRVTVIPDSLFLSNSVITECDFFKGELTKIGDLAIPSTNKNFKWHLANLSKVTWLGDNAFPSSSNWPLYFSNIDNVTHIGKEGLGCANVSNSDLTFYYRADVYYGEGAIRSAKGFTKVKVEEGVTELPKNFLYYNKTVTEIALPSTLKIIREKAFDSTVITKFDIPEGVETIESSAFSSISAEELSIPGSVKETPEFMLSYSKNKKLILNEGVETINRRLFWYGGYELTDMVLPSTLRSIYNSVYANGSENAFNSGLNKTVRIWNMMTDASLCENIDQVYYSSYNDAAAFTDYFVLMGTSETYPKSTTYKTYQNTFPIEFTYKEVPVTLTYPEEHNVATTHESATIAFTPEIELDLTDLGIDAATVPNVFRQADIRHFKDNLMSLELEYRPEGTEEWVAAEKPEHVYNGRYFADINNLDYNTTYEYRLKHTVGDNTYTDAIRTFKTQYPAGVETIENRGLHIWPNPATTCFNVAAQGRIEVYSIAGALMIAADATAGCIATVSVETLAPGIYIVRYTAADGTPKAERLIVK